MGMNLIVAIVLAIGAQTARHEWAPVGISNDEGTTLHFVDRASIKPGARGVSAWIYSVTKSASVSMHLGYDCASARYRRLEASDVGGATPGASSWQAIKQGTPLHATMRYACSGGKLDLGFGDLVVESDTPEAFAREFIARRSQKD